MSCKVFLVMRKELRRFFYDTRTVFTVLVLPGLMIYFIYAFLVPFITARMLSSAKPHTVYVVNLPASLEGKFEPAGLFPAPLAAEAANALIADISGKSGDHIIIFPAGFDEAAAAYTPGSGMSAPDVQYYYNSLADGYAEYAPKISAFLAACQSGMTKRFDINREGGGDTAKKEDTSGRLLSIIAPLLILMFIYHGAVAAATESITGEKERGSFAMILLTPITPGELTAGKLLGLGLESFLCGLSGAAGTLLSMPRLFGSVVSGMAATGAAAGNVELINLSHYALDDWAAAILIIFVATWLLVTVIALVCVLAKTVKEAQMLLVPFSFAIMSLALFSAYDGGGALAGAIPLLGCTQALSAVFSGSWTAAQLVLTAASHALYVACGGWLLARLFSSEKVMFNR